MSPRIRFFEPNDEPEAERYLSQVARIDRFWQSFRQQCQRPPATWLPQLRGLLGEINPGLGLELRRQDDGTRSLSFSCLDSVQLRPLADLFVERAPQLPPWLFEATRTATPLKQALSAVEQDHQLDLSGARLRLGIGRGHLINVVLASHHFAGAEDERGLAAAQQLVELVLGDQLFDDWVGDIAITTAARPSALRLVNASEHELPLELDQLEEAFDLARAGILAALPEAPLHLFCERADWVLFELEEPAELDRQQDLLTATTMCPEMLKCFLSGERFCSRRFSRNRELFCYLKIAQDAPAEERLAERELLEDALNRALVPGQLGCVVGAGIGSEHIYIDLALAQLDPAIRLIRRRLREHQAPMRSWLLFCDDEWQREWVGIWDETPPPGV